MSRELKNASKNAYMISYWKKHPDKYVHNMALKKSNLATRNMYNKMEGMLSNKTFQTALTRRVKELTPAERQEFIAALQAIE
jgi:hypothetical protein